MIDRSVKEREVNGGAFNATLFTTLILQLIKVFDLLHLEHWTLLVAAINTMGTAYLF